MGALQQLCCQALTWSEADPALTDGISPHYPWRMHQAGAGGLRRMKRAWVIPPISVSENVKQIPKLLVQINSDKQKLGSVIYSIKGPGVDEEPRGFFNINTTTGAIYLNAMLDREEHDIFKLTAFALDLHGKPLEEPTNLTIVVVDQNDNRPVFKNINITGHVLEGSTPGTYVTKAEATDADDPQTDNGALRYSIIEQDSPQMFSIDKDTGVIRTVQVGLDREIVDRYNLTIQVGDMSGIGLTTSATAVIYVGDINDNPPEFTQQKFVMEVMEQTVDVDIGRVSVQDKDLRGSPNWLAKYIILLNTDPLGDFAIRTDPVTNDGILSVVKPLDHEAQEQVELADDKLLETLQEKANFRNFKPKPFSMSSTVEQAMTSGICYWHAAIRECSAQPKTSKLFSPDMASATPSTLGRTERNPSSPSEGALGMVSSSCWTYSRMNTCRSGGRQMRPHSKPDIWQICLNTTTASGNCTEITNNIQDFQALQAVQATMIMATTLCCIGLFSFVLQLFRLKQGERFVFTAIIQLLSCVCVLIGASIYAAKHEDFHAKLSNTDLFQDGTYGYCFILAWVAFAFTLISSAMYLILRKRK